MPLTSGATLLRAVQPPLWLFYPGYWVALSFAVWLPSLPGLCPPGPYEGAVFSRCAWRSRLSNLCSLCPLSVHVFRHLAVFIGHQFCFGLKSGGAALGTSLLFVYDACGCLATCEGTSEDWSARGSLGGVLRCGRGFEGRAKGKPAVGGRAPSSISSLHSFSLFSFLSVLHFCFYLRPAGAHEDHRICGVNWSRSKGLPGKRIS